MRIIPTLLTTTKEEFATQIDLFQKYYDRIQIDITDGELVPNTTTQLEDIIQLIDEGVVRIEPKTLFDFHLMVNDYETELKKIQSLQQLNMNVNLSLVHALHHPNIPELNPKYDFAIGLDIFPKQQIDDIAHHYDLNYVPSIQIMTVSPGFQGSPFMPDMLHKIEQLRTQNYRGEIMIDGGVNETSLTIIKNQKYKPDYLCVGSYLTKAGEKFEERVNLLKQLQSIV